MFLFGLTTIQVAFHLQNVAMVGEWERAMGEWESGRVGECPESDWIQRLREKADLNIQVLPP